MGFAGNMDALEAVELAGASRASVTLPMHYDMFAQNVDADALATFTRAAADAGLAHVVLPVGRRYDVRGKQ